MSLALLVWFVIFDFGAAKLLTNDLSWRVPHHFYHHALSANVDATDYWGPLTATIHTNDIGAKDAATRHVARRFDGYRLLVLGDSFTEGIGYPFEQSFPGVFQKLARDKGQALEVINGGVASHSPRLYYLHLKYLLDLVQLHVDELWVFIDISDAQDEVTYRHFHPMRKDDAQIFAREVNGFLTRNSYLYGQVLLRRYRRFTESVYATVYRWGSRIGLTRAGAEPAALYDSLEVPARSEEIARRLDRDFASLDSYRPWDQVELWPEGGYMTERYDWYDNPRSRKRWADDGLALARSYMRLVVELARSRNIPVNIAIYPASDSLGRDSGRYEADWRDFANSLGVPFLNLFDLFRKLGLPSDEIQRRYFIDGDYHFNADGYRLVGEGWFVDWMKRRSGTAPPR